MIKTPIYSHTKILLPSSRSCTHTAYAMISREHNKQCRDYYLNLKNSSYDKYSSHMDKTKEIS
jgi:hypothetical protein